MLGGRDDRLSNIRGSAEPPAATGARLRLWLVSARQDPPGTLPVDDVKLAAWAGVSAKEWANEIRAYVVSGWTIEGDRYVLRRVIEQAHRAMEISSKRSLAA